MAPRQRAQQGGGPRGGSAEHGHEGGRPPSQKGQAIVLIALMMAVLVGFVALAVDSARAFDGRRVLQDSTDAAALAAAESYQTGVNWTAAQTNALQLFERDNRLYSGHTCVPSSFLVPNPGGATVTTTCTMSGGSGYVLTLKVDDNGPAGQSFELDATRPLTVALMQVLGQAPVITLSATSIATANDQSLTPALAGLSQAGCFGNGGTTPFSIVTSTTPFPTVIGDVVSNGSAGLDASSSLRLGGDMLTRCAAPTNQGNVAYECWPAVATWPPYGTPPCTGAYVQGSLRSTASRFADPAYLPPSFAGLVSQPTPLDNVVLSPGKYALDPQFGSTRNACYFLPGGVYEWQGGLTVSGGLISNELRPPSEPGSTPAFWRMSGANRCDGQLATSIAGVAEGQGLSPAGNWPVVVTSVRLATYNGVNYKQESAPSACQSVTFPGGGADNALVVKISNVPGATSYNVYTAAPPATCAGPLGWVASITNSQTETTTSLGTCPDPNGGTCSLKAVSGTFDISKIPANFSPNAGAPQGTLGAYSPDPQATTDFQGGTTFPGVNHARATYPSGDRANENFCAAASGVQNIACPAAVTPGAVTMSLTNGTCFNVNSGGDAHLFSGYQYNWVLNYEPLSTTCANTWQGRSMSAPIGMSYTPGASFKFVGGNASQTRSFGGVVAGSILLQSATGLALIFNSAYAPRPPGTRLTG
jgi:hypothetical protein